MQGSEFWRDGLNKRLSPMAMPEGHMTPLMSRLSKKQAHTAK